LDFTWTTEQVAFKEQVLQFAKESLDNPVTERDGASIFSRESWQKCADFGILKLAVPAEFGGKSDGIDILIGTLAMEALGYGCRDNGLTFGLNAQMWTVQLPLDRFVTPAQKSKYLPRLASGEWIGCHALTDPNAGSDVFNLEMIAEKVTGGYLLNGN
jgi:alkylation response protein AidB-like acyl-CoA dehydrogenase